MSSFFRALKYNWIQFSSESLLAHLFIYSAHAKHLWSVWSWEYNQKSREWKSVCPLEVQESESISTKEGRPDGEALCMRHTESCPGMQKRIWAGVVPPNERREENQGSQACVRIWLLSSLSPSSNGKSINEFHNQRCSRVCILKTWLQLWLMKQSERTWNGPDWGW
jgi:hypothetical protein